MASTAAPNVSRTARAASAGRSAGSVSRPLRYTAAPMLPSTAMPRAPPSSAPVSDIPEAAPAFSRCAADDELGGECEHGRHGERDHHRSDDHQPETLADADLGQHKQTARSRRQRSPEHERGSEAVDEVR